ncbi:hypothetical protein [Herminiimonas sp. CN]|uniref:hypothetical protein n=1 Tax=Herminiimonas sp. CN TaxID=1349818 RepID=UPI0004743ED2|nr:hypothetical protein [Herminiimonas sp. CN]
MLTATNAAGLAHYSTLFEKAAKARKSTLPTAQSSISELETKINGVDLVQIGSCCVEVEYSYSPGCKEEPATMGDPGSPGDAPQVEIWKVTLTSPMVFADASDDDAVLMTLEAGFNITDFFPRTAHWDGKISDIEDEILSRMEDA